MIGWSAIEITKVCCRCIVVNVASELKEVKLPCYICVTSVQHITKPVTETLVLQDSMFVVNM